MQRTVAILALMTAGGLAAGDRTEGLRFTTRSVVFARHGMVAAAHPLAVQIGVDILKKGGTAADAAIAVNAALGFMEPMSCGIGGDLFALVWDAKSGHLYGLNASGRSPRALTADMVPAEPDGTIPRHTPYTWTVPGAVDGWFALHGRFGRLPIAELLAPTIRAAREGEPVPQVIAASWEQDSSAHRDKPGFAATFLPGGRALREGEIFRNPSLAKAYEALAVEGRDVFYRGAIAHSIVELSRRSGGFLSTADLEAHLSDWVDPISTDYRGIQVFELPPNGQGLAALEMLNVLERFDLRSMGRDSPEFWHTLIEAKKLAYDDLARYVGDPAFSRIPVEGLISKRHARERAKHIDPRRAALRIEAGHPPLERGDTTYLAVADAEGNMVSLIQSNYWEFGSGYVVEEWGFGIQNRGALFNLKPGLPNSLQPGKRPFHTIIPAFAMRGGKPWLAFGLMGGAMQAQGHAQVIVNLVDFEMNLQEAGDAPRLYHSGSSEPTGTVMTAGGLVHLESGVPAQVRRELVKLGHEVAEAVGPFGGYQAIARDRITGVLSGASESRKDGCAMGY